MDKGNYNKKNNWNEKKNIIEKKERDLVITVFVWHSGK